MHPDEDSASEVKKDVSLTEDKIYEIKQIFNKIEKKLRPVLSEPTPEKSATIPAGTILYRLLCETQEYGDDVLKRISL